MLADCAGGIFGCLFGRLFERTPMSAPPTHLPIAITQGDRRVSAPKSSPRPFAIMLAPCAGALWPAMWKPCAAVPRRLCVGGETYLPVAAIAAPARCVGGAAALHSGAAAARYARSRPLGPGQPGGRQPPHAACNGRRAQRWRGGDPLVTAPLHKRRWRWPAWISGSHRTAAGRSRAPRRGGHCRRCRCA